MLKNLTPRSTAALAVVAASFFLIVCVSRYGGAALVDPKGVQAAGLTVRTAAWLVETVGAGVWALLLLPMAWGVIVYFDERTPDLLMRFVGTVVLAVATSGIVGLLHGGAWAGQVGNAFSGALGGLEGRMGGFGTALAWLVALSLFGVSLMFATDWLFHTLRRASRAAANEPAPIAVEPPAAELLEDPAQAQAREFVVETPRAAVAAAELKDSVGESSSEAATPSGWQETEDEGRMVISAPSGYRGVEFLPPSDELAASDAPAEKAVEPVSVVVSHDAPAESEPVFRDEEFIATTDAAYFAESPAARDDGSEMDTQDIEIAEAADEEEAAEDPVVAEAVQALLEAIATPEPVAAPAVAAERVGGIGLPEESPFVDEFFAADAGWPYAPEPFAAANDGASAANEMASRYASLPTPVPAPERGVTPALAADTAPVFEDDVVSVEDILLRLPADAFDESIAVVEELSTDELLPASFETTPEFVPTSDTAFSAADTASEAAASAVAVAVAEPVAAPVAEPAPQLTLFADSATPQPSVEPAAAVAPAADVDLSRLHAMEVDPMFQDAVAAVLDRGRASAVVLQRQLGIGYARGIRILDQMTAAGLVGPDTPTGSREIRVTKDAWAAFAAQ